MSATLMIRDEQTAGGTLQEFPLTVQHERMSIRELIRERVYQEVKDHNEGRGSHSAFRGLVQPERERQLNDSQAKRAVQIDWRQQFEVAIDAFEHARILVFVDDRQAESLDEEFEPTKDTKVSFLRLIPLVGG